MIAAKLSPSSPPAENQLGPVAQRWLRALFAASHRAPWLPIALRPLAITVAIRGSRKARFATTANARRLISPTVSPNQIWHYAHRVVGRFYDFVCDVGRCQGQTPEQLRARVDAVDGHDLYAAARAGKKGAIIITAHMGSFELGLAALTEIESNVHVVFKRDEFDQFEILRRALRQTLGVHEAAIDDGWPVWMRLRDALRNDHVVVLQGDRAMPGQKCQTVPFAGGHIALPVGPVTLAMASGSPIIPIFTLATGRGRCKVCVEPPIVVDPNADLIDGALPAVRQIARAIEKYVVAHPDQWLVLDPAFTEDTIGCE